MAHEVQDALTGPTYIVISRYSDGEVWLNETKLNASLQDAISDVDQTHQIIMLEGSNAVDVSAEAADLWWKLHGDACDDWTDVPEFIADHLHNEIFQTFAERDYNAHCWWDQQVSCNPRVL